MKPYEKGYLQVSDGHRLYYERCGNRSGIPVVFLHGGPGSGFVESHKKVFDFRKFNVLFFDQRGAGRSKPYASLKANTTDKLISDINFLLDHFDIGKALFYGGSWGSTLALVYAIRHLNRVSALVLRGIFLANAESLRHYVGGGVEAYAPEAWQRFIAQVPTTSRKNLVNYYFRKMKSSSAATRRKYCYEWSYYEMSISSINVNPSEIGKLLVDYSYESLARLEAHYSSQKFFLPNDFIIRNAKKLSSIPVSIVHGRYDLICRPLEAYNLHKVIKGSRLKLVCAGHSSSDPEIKKALQSELLSMAKRLR